MQNINQRYNTLAIGVTGGIGSGKTKVCEILSAFGVKCIQADKVAQEIMRTDKKVVKQIRQVIGPDAYLPSGLLNKQLISSLIFNNHDLQEKINKIVHPVVINLIKSEIEIEKINGTIPLIVNEAALIYEARSENIYDYIIVVDASQSVRLKRLKEKDGSNRKEILDRMNSQMSPDEKRLRADFVIKNNSTIEHLETQTKFIYSVLLALARLSDN
ncbi:MAG: dephospho-CoA kinase [Ignavibacteriales bacterium]|nr:dephospho-CoA kinase [Ignavibacteriales bacterium]